MKEINGKVYPMYQQFLDNVEDFIGRKLIEHDNFWDDSETTITGFDLVENGEDSAMFVIKGGAFDASFDVKYSGLISRNGNLCFSTNFGTEWEIV